MLIAYTIPQQKYLIGIACFVAIISDIFDGIIARKLQIATASLRVWDSYIDLLFWLSAAWCVWVCFPNLIINNKWLVISLLFLELLPDAIYILRFKRLGCAHSYASKLFALLLFGLFCILFFSNVIGIYFYIVIVVGIIAEIDRAFIACLLPARICDVPSFFHAILIRKSITFKKNKLFHS